MELKAEEISCSLAPWDKKIDVAVNLLSSPLTMGRRSLMHGLVVPKGSPK
jgi:hypothetical protein